MIAQKGWDFFGVSEDFEFHEQLVTHLDDYNVGKYRGTVTSKNTSAKNMADTDGLCFMWKKDVEVGGETMVPWTKKFGSITNGADECIDKGYRYYWVKFADGFELDVYVHHMNSGSDAGHLEARAAQLNQLADAIIASDNKRPILIMGDSNCRWTRDPLADNLFDRINADPRFTINDPWVDYMWGGWRPSLGSSLMVGDLGNQKGEVVDKIFYINNTDAEGIHLSANGYLHDDSFVREDGVTGLGDHFPIVIEFKIEDGYVAPEPGPEPADGNLTGKEFYLRNVADGSFLKAGGAWGTHAIIGETGNRITMLKGDADDSYALRSTLGFINDPSNFAAGSDFYMDAAAPRYFTMTAVEGSEAYTFTYQDAEGKTMALSSISGDALASANGAAYAEGDAAQQWQLVSEKELIEALAAAREDNPMSATFLVRGYDIGVNDSDNNAWKLEAGSSVKQETWGPNEWNTKTWVYRVYNSKIYGTDATKGHWSVTQTVGNLPDGKYRLSCQMLTDNITTEGEYKFTLNGVPVEGVKDVGKGGKIKVEEALTAFATGEYDITVELTITGGQLVIRMEQADHTTASVVCFDNFSLTYLGPELTTVEYEAEGIYDTLILPFDHEIPAGLSVYSVAGYLEKKDSHYVLELVPEDAIKANVPYVVKAAQSRAGSMYEFTGVAVNDADNYTFGVLTGTHKAIEALPAGYVLKHEPELSSFVRLSDGTTAAVPAHHAYINDTEATVPVIHFEKQISTGIDDIAVDADASVTVYSISGYVVLDGVTMAEAGTLLQPGIYLVRQGAAVGKVIVK